MASKPRILYLSYAGDDVYTLIRDTAGGRFELVFLDSDEEQERCHKITMCDGVICAATPLTAQHLEAGQKLQVIHHQGVGWQDTTDWRAIKTRNLPLALTPEGTTIGVAEHTVLLMLAAAKHLSFADREIRRGRWHINTLRGISREIHGKTIGYIGMGRIAEAVAERLKAFGCVGIYTDPIRTLDDEVERTLGLRSGTFDEVLVAADFLTVHVPLTTATRGMISAEEFSKLKPGAIVINTARGGIVDEQALIKALKSGHVLAAGLDVFDNEPLAADNPLLSFPNVVVSPHISAGTEDAMRQKMTAIFDNMERFFSVGELANRVDFP